jgi:hypothetical protein
VLGVTDTQMARPMVLRVASDCPLATVGQGRLSGIVHDMTPAIFALKSCGSLLQLNAAA